MCKLIPKKFGKRKYLKGLEETKKKLKEPKTEKKKVDKKPKTELMPCLQSKKKELDEQRKQEKEAAEKAANLASEKKQVKKVLSISKPVLHTKKNGTSVRDVATQMKYYGDGTGLSLMEIDILNHTGCKWSKILYPGFKGNVKPQDQRSLGSVIS
jgi:hypothetical protein